MGVTIDGLRLWQVQDDTVAVDGSLDVTSPPGQSASASLLVSLEAVETATLAGLATGPRLTRESGYSSDPQTALGQWLQQFETLVNPDQGGGWDITDDERSRTITVTATALSWTFASGDPVAARYTLDVTRGEGVMPSSARDPDSPEDATATPNNTSTLDGNDLGTVTEKRVEKRVDVTPTPIALQGPDATVITPNGGAVRRTTLGGRRTDTDANLETFDDNFRGLIGGNQSVSYQTGMPGSTHTVVVSDYDSTYSAGATAHLDYGLTVVEGVTI